jgi:acyl-CoA thioester hydrolase
MNVMWYVGRFDEATWQFLGSIGLTPSYLRKQRRMAVAVDQRIAYRRELFAGDLISVHSAALEVGVSSFRFVHEMVHDESGDLVAATILTGVHVDAETHRSCPLPEDLRRSAEGRLASEPTCWNEWPPQKAWLPSKR